MTDLAEGDTLRVGSLFSGIGGLDLGLEAAGMRVIWQSEIDPYACRVLAKHWPDVPNLGDVTQIEWSKVERPDLICGGYPCQPFSYAGLRRGHDDERHLWPLMRTAICLLRPQWVLLENVAGHLGLGFDSVLAELAVLGFDADWSLVSACSMGAPHTRARLFCVAYADSSGREWLEESDELTPTGVATPLGNDLDRQGVARERSWNQGRPGSLGMADGLPGWVERRRALGNAVVPQIAEWIGHRIVEAAA